MSASELLVTKTNDRGVTTLFAVGSLTIETSHILSEPLISCCEDPDGSVVVDLCDVTYVSSAGLRVFMMAAKRLRERNARLILRRVPPVILGILKLTNFTRFLDVEPL